jgi:hypothetical protein
MAVICFKISDDQEVCLPFPLRLPEPGPFRLPVRIPIDINQVDNTGDPQNAKENAAVVAVSSAISDAKDDLPRDLRVAAESLLGRIENWVEGKYGGTLLNHPDD